MATTEISKTAAADSLKNPATAAPLYFSLGVGPQDPDPRGELELPNRLVLRVEHPPSPERRSAGSSVLPMRTTS